MVRVRFSAAIVMAAILILAANAVTHGEGPSTKFPLVNRELNTEGFQLTAHTTQEAFQPTEPIVLQATLKNVSDKVRTYVRSQPEEDFALTVSDDWGEGVPLTKYGQSLKERFRTHFSIGSAPLASGEEEHVTLLVNRIYDMSKSGGYSIVVKHHVPKLDRMATVEVVSNTVHVRVVTTPPDSVATQVALAPPNVTVAVLGQDSAPTHLWQLGDSWKLFVELYSRKPSSEVKAAAFEQPSSDVLSFIMQVTVVGTETVGERACWQVDFVPRADAPNIARGQQYRVLIDTQNGAMRQVSSARQPAEVFQAGDIFMTTGTAMVFPVEIFSPADLEKDQATEDNPKETAPHWTFKTQDDPDTREVVATLHLGRNANTVVRQRWDAGAKWWSAYQKEDTNSGIGVRVTNLSSAKAGWGAVTAGVQVSAHVAEPLATGAQPIMLELALRNTTNAALMVPAALPEQYFKLMVRNARGEIMPLTAYGKQLFAAKAGLATLSLPGGQEAHYKILLNRLYDMTAYDTYLITATYNVIDPKLRGVQEATSNTAQTQVKPE